MTKPQLPHFTAILAVCWLALSLATPQSARATPAFAVQTNQPCAACHVGAYGPQLTPYGRDFKLYGYTADDGKSHFPPVALMGRETFTHTKADQPQPPGSHFAANDNLTIGEISLFYTGKISDDMGVYLEPLSYDGTSHELAWANSEFRMVHEGKVGGLDYLAGLTVNNAPTVSDLWNSTNQWGWPFDAPELAPEPAASTLVGDGQAEFEVVGVGGYSMINDWVYLEADLYKGLTSGLRHAFGVADQGVDTYGGAMPYWRAAIQHSFDHDHQYLEVGTLGMIADVHPGGDNSFPTDHKSDVGLDANYQWFGKNDGSDHLISAHAIYVQENLTLHGSQALSGSNATDKLSEVKANISYSYKNTLTPTVGLFRTWGSDDPAYWGTSTGSASPNSNGYLAELTYVPWGKQKSPFPGLNFRFEFQYWVFTRFDGVTRNASDNNAFFFNVGAFIDPVPYLTK